MIELRASLQLVLLVALLATAGAEASSPTGPCEPQGPDTLYEQIPSFGPAELKQQLSKDLTAAADLLRIGDLPQARVALSQAGLAATYLALPRLLPTPTGMNGVAEGSIEYPGLGIHYSPGPQIEVSRTFRSAEGDIQIRVILWEGHWFSVILKLDRRGDQAQSINIGKRPALLVVGHGGSPYPCAAVVFAVDPVRQVWIGPKCSPDKDANARAVLTLAERIDPDEIARGVEANLLADDFLDDLIPPKQRFLWRMHFQQGTPLVNVVDSDGLLAVEKAIYALFERVQLLAAQDEPLASRAALDDMDELIGSLIERELYDCLPATIDWPLDMKMPPYDGDIYHGAIPPPACREKGPPTYFYSATRSYEKGDLHASIELSSETPFDGALLSSKIISVRPMSWDGHKGRYGDHIDIEVDSPAAGNGHRKLIADQVDLKCLARVVAGQALR